MRSAWKTINAVVFCALLALSVIAQAKKVDDVEIRGYKRVSLEEIKKRIQTESGKNFDLELAQQDLARLLEMDVFDPLKSRLVVTDGPRGGKIVAFVLHEKP
jgi:outer membrane protein assembly factor BamA